MKKQEKAKANSLLVNVLLVLLLALVLNQTFQVTHAQDDNTSNNQWAMNFLVENNQNVTNTTFAPFDQIQLIAMVTYGNASQPNILVSFNVTGPSNSSIPNRITRIETTDSNGEASFSFRLPIETENESQLLGTWQAFATIQTTNGTLQQTQSFTTQWNLEITSISLQNSQNQSQTIFYPGNTVLVQIAINNQGQPQTANISLDIRDSTGRIVNQTQIQNNQISTSSANPTQVETSLQIPNNTSMGEATINAAITSGNYQNMDLPVAENKTAYFTIAASTAPTPPPPLLKNALSLFPWLLIAVGIITFTILVLFLRRKPRTKPVQTPIFAPSTPSPVTDTPKLSQPTTPQEVIQQSAAQTIAPTPKIAREKVMGATIMSEMNLNETKETQSKPIATTEVGKTDLKSALTQQEAAQTTIAYLGRISSLTKRIQAIRDTLKSEREQLAQDITELNKLLDEQERTLKNYLGTVRQEMEKAKITLTEMGNTTDTTTKTNTTPDLTQEPTSQTILSYRNRITSTEKRIQSLNIALKLEKEQLTQDITELNKAVDQQQKTLNNYFDIVRQEIEKLQNFLKTDKD